MGLVKAILGATSGVFADQWKEYFYCDALDVNTIVVRGDKKISDRSSNRHSSSNIISNGSVISVADGQCMIIVEQGRVIELCAEPGEYIFDSSIEPSIFAGKLDKDSISDLFNNIGKRFGFGGEAAIDQRVYYFNTKEFTGNAYGTPAPVPFRVVDKNIGLDLDITIRCFGEYSYRITNPLLFYSNVCGNVEDRYLRSQIDEQLKSELLTSLQPAFADISEMGIRYSALPKHTEALADSLNKILSEKWKNLRGIEISSLGISSIKADEKDEAIIKELQRNATFKDPTMAAAQLVGAQSVAMQEAARNQNAGAAMAFMGVNLANQAGGINAQELFKIGNTYHNDIQQEVDEDKWQCSCGKTVVGKFCSHCGMKKPENNLDYWVCECGNKNEGIFCSNCGTRRPDNTSYVCKNCGRQTAKTNEPLKFCSHCGTPFHNNL